LADVLQVSTGYLLDGYEPTPSSRHQMEEHEIRREPSLAELISSARETIAQAAGLPTSNVRVILDYDN
jgi:hypothetical protein